LPGKTIIFAMTQPHVLHLQTAFDEMYPQFLNLTKVITHKSEYRGTLVDAFKKKDAPRMKNKARYDTFLGLDLVDSIAISGYILLTKSGEKMYVAEYRRLVEQRILELVANHPTIMAIQNGEKMDDWQLLELERTLTEELGEGDLEVTPENLKKVFGHTADSFLGLVRQVLDMQYLPDDKDLVARQFETCVTQHNYNADQIRFLRAVQSVFLQKCHLETADLYEPPLDMFGADAVEGRFTEGEVEEVIEFANKMAV
jgi:type I restriction enzyme, R subunit